MKVLNIFNLTAERKFMCGLIRKYAGEMIDIFLFVQIWMYISPKSIISQEMYAPVTMINA